MKLIATAIEGPTPGDRVRLTAEVEYAAAGLRRERYWIEAPASLTGEVCRRSDPWLAILAPLAVTMQERLVVDTVDPDLLEGVLALMQVWSGWYPGTVPVPVDASPVERASARPGLTACFFSGGVDSFFSVVSRQEPELRHLPPIDELLLVHGLDIPITAATQFDRLRARLQRAADELGHPLQVLSTNLRETTWQRADWEHLAHGCALAGLGLALGDRYSRVLIPSSINFMRPHRPWGSHPLTDPLFSTSGTSVRADGARFRRIEKTEVVGRSEIARRYLHVCWRHGSDENCGRCLKCLRTLTLLELFGTRDAAESFPSDAFSLERLGRMYLGTPSDYRVMGRLANDARRMDRPEIARAIEKSIRHTRWSKPIADRARRLSRAPGIGRVAWRIERALLGDRIR